MQKHSTVLSNIESGTHFTKKLLPVQSLIYSIVKSQGWTKSQQVV